MERSKSQKSMALNGMFPLVGVALLLALTSFPGGQGNAQSTPKISAEYTSENAGEQTDYLSEMSDIPMMPGMVEQDGGGFVFDAPDGRVVEEVVFLEKKNPNDVLGYYSAVLPQLGWIARKSGVFSRNNEQLTVNIDKVGGGVKVTFRLSPQPSPESD